MNFSDADYYFMREALKEAHIAFQKDEVPIGAIVVYDNKILSRAHNLTETLQDATAHAEIIALTSAMEKLGSKYLTDAVLYVTLEPCIMCVGAAYWSKISKIIFGAYDIKNGFLQFDNITRKYFRSFIPNIEVYGGLLEDEAADILKKFFLSKRKY